MTVKADPAEAITLLRKQGYEDHAIALLFQASRIPLPQGNFLRWSIPAINSVAGDRPGTSR